MKIFSMTLLTATEYLEHKYELPKKFPELPMTDENELERERVAGKIVSDKIVTRVGAL